MKLHKSHILDLILPGILFILAFTINFSELTGEWWPISALPREVPLILAFLLWNWGFSRIQWFQKLTIPKKLGFLGLDLVLILVGMRVLSGSLKDVFSLDPYGYPLLRYPVHGVYLAAIFIIVLLGFSALAILKELIFIQQRKSTQRNYRMLFFLIFITGVYSLWLHEKGAFFQGFDILNNATTVDYILFSLFCIFSIVNGFRCKWIHYLSKPRKVLVFFVGTIVFTVLLFNLIRPFCHCQIFSLFVVSCLNYFLLFMGIYLGMALFGILLLLPSAGLMDRKIREIRFLQDLSSTIGSVFEKNELIAKAVDLAHNVVDADATWIELKESGGYQLAGTFGIKKEMIKKIPDTVFTSIRNSLKKSDEALLVSDVFKDDTTFEMKQWEVKTGSLLAARICFKKKELGILYALKKERYGFIEDTRDLFQAFASQVAAALQNTKLVQVTIDQQVYKEELKIAHEAQMRILPQSMPEIKGVEIEGYCGTANEIGGDFYDIIKINEDRVDILVGDVSGKGAEAAFCMAELKGVIQALVPHHSSPKKLILEINTFILNNFDPNMFATMVYGIYLPKEKKIRVVRTGHPPICLIRNNEVTWIETKGLGLGLVDNEFMSKSLMEKTVSLRKEDVLFFHTDGVEEARNAKGDEFGEQAVTEMLQGLKGKNAKEIAQEIHQKIEQFIRRVPRHDDITYVVMKVV